MKTTENFDFSIKQLQYQLLGVELITENDAQRNRRSDREKQATHCFSEKLSADLQS